MVASGSSAEGTRRKHMQQRPLILNIGLLNCSVVQITRRLLHLMHRLRSPVQMAAKVATRTQNNIPRGRGRRPTDAKHATTCTIGHASLLDNLSAARKKPSAIRPVQVFRPVVSVHGQHPESHLPSQQIKYSSPVAQFEQNVNGSKRTHTPSTSAYNTVEKRQEYDYSSNSNANLEVPLKTTVTLRRRRSSPGESPK